ncbi:MAG: usg protein [Caulobacterales bacterium]|nr:usg protein [Caulobacterales bacterium]
MKLTGFDLSDHRRVCLATAEVLYFLPDHPSLLQSFIWQTHDFAPRFPRIEKFLDFWRREIDAAIHSVNITHVAASRAHAPRVARAVLTLN